MTDVEPAPRKSSLIEKRAATDAAALAIIDQEVLERGKKLSACGRCASRKKLFRPLKPRPKSGNSFLAEQGL